jgi:RND family efflux transporter MFP subunit
MQTGSSKPARDALATLKIDRSDGARPRARGGWWRRLLILFVVLIVASLALMGAIRAGWIQPGSSAANDWLSIPDIIKNRPEVRVVRPVVESGRAADATVVATGYLESRRQARIGARAPGRIQEVTVEEGSRVKQDQVLAVLEHADLDASLAATEASLKRARAAIEEQRVLIAQNLREFERAKNLLSTRSISDSEFDTAKYDYESAVARLESLKAEVELAVARQLEAEQLKENMFIRAPFDGTVISKDAEVGESILPGGMGDASGRGSAVTIADLDNLEVDCDVKEDYISRVHSGQATEVAVDAVPDRRYQGIVRKVIPMGDRARATIKVKVTITDVDDRLFPDMSATVYFLPEVKPGAEVSEAPRMFCPADAVQQDAEGEFVWVVDARAHAQKVRVSTGAAKDGRIEIISGLTGDEKVVSNPPNLNVDQPVKIGE